MRFLTAYRTPHKTTGRSQAEILLGWKMRGRLELIYAPQNPPPTDEISAKFKIGEPVLGKDLWSGKNKWLEGNVQQRLGSYLYTVQVEDKLLKRHTNQLLPRIVTYESRREEATTATLSAQDFPVPTIQNTIHLTAAMGWLFLDKK